MASIFTKIIQGEIPCYKIYENEQTFAFLDINPKTKGHTLVVPKIEVDKIYDLDDVIYQALWATAKKLAKHYEEVLHQRIFFKVIGTDVPHAHIHLIPQSEDYQAEKTLNLTEAEFEEIASQLKIS